MWVIALTKTVNLLFFEAPCSFVLDSLVKEKERQSVNDYKLRAVWPDRAFLKGLGREHSPYG